VSRPEVVLFRGAFQRCRYCGRLATDIDSRRMHCCYQDPHSNFITCCGDCFELVQADWRDLWEDYYAAVM
jgi:hypothetical protein